MTGKKELSLCLMTKNNEQYLLDCLNNMKDIMDEVIVVDFGSTDQTVDIAKKAGANVYHRKWKEDFSEIKNVCLDVAQGRWVLFLQTNETIPADQLKKLPLLLKNPNAEGYLLYIDQSFHKNRISSPVQSLRLFRNRKEHRYQYRVFERIPDEHIHHIKDAGMRIIQHREHSLLKGMNINDVLQDEMAKNSHDSYLYYMYGIQLLNEKRHEQGTIYLQRARQKVKERELFAPHLYKCLSWGLIFLKQKVEAFRVLEEGIKYFPAYTDFFVLRGELWKQEKQYDHAIRDLEQCLEIKKQPHAIVPKPEIHLSVVLEALAEVHERIGNEKKALTYYKQSYEVNPVKQQLLYKIGELTKSLGKDDIIENMIKKAEEDKNLKQLMVLMDIYLQQHKYSQVLSYIDKAGQFLSNKDHVAGIKFFCYMMLGKMQKAEAHFSMISKESPIFDHVLLQRIESCWFYDDWPKAAQLLKEMEQRKSIDQNMKNLYHLLQRAWTEKVKTDSLKPLPSREYEIVSALMENLLWNKQEKKAKRVLPLLLQEGKGNEHYIKLAQLWADKNDFLVIQSIFECISDKQEQLEFKQRIIKKLLRNENILTSYKVKQLGKEKSLGDVDYVLWSRNFMNNVEKCIKKGQQVKSSGPFSLTTKEKPPKTLLAFYQTLCMENKHSTMEESDSGKTCSEIHNNIGEIFEKRQKDKEAFTAYLRSLQWDPQNEYTQEKISDMFRNNQAECGDILERTSWPLEGPVFRHKEVFIHYVLGLMHFKERRFNQAHQYFEEINDDEMLYPIVQSYIFSCLWLSGKEDEVKERMSDLNKADDIISTFYRICKRHVLDKLGEVSEKHRNGELIKEEQERIKKMWY